MVNTKSMIHDARCDGCGGDGGGHVLFIVDEMCVIFYVLV